MKIIYPSPSRQRGFATIVFITLLAIMVVLATANTTALIRLHREVRLLEQNQIKRINGPLVNAAPAAHPQNSNSK
jgi:hypothetical protein